MNLTIKNDCPLLIVCSSSLDGKLADNKKPERFWGIFKTRKANDVLIQISPEVVWFGLIHYSAFSAAKAM